MRVRMALICLFGILGAWANPIARDIMLADYDHLRSGPTHEQISAALQTAAKRLESTPPPAVEVITPQIETLPRVTPPQPTANPEQLVGVSSSITAEQIEDVLREYDSPALLEPSLANHLLSEGDRTSIDPAHVLSMFIFESGAGSNPAWAGNLGGGEYSNNPGNIVCTESARQIGCYGRFGVYRSWADGFSDKFELLACYAEPQREYCPGLWTGAPLAENSVTAAVHRWAPPSDNNDSAGYARFVVGFANEYRALNTGSQLVFPAVPADAPVSPSLPTYADLLAEMPALPEVSASARGVVRSSPLPLDGYGVYTRACIEANVLYTLGKSPGLERGSIAPEADWSWFEHNGSDLAGETKACYGILAAGWCDLAARYAEVARQLNLGRQFDDHSWSENGGIDLAIVGPDDNVVVWGAPGVRGGQDLYLTNTTDQTFNYRTVIEGDTLFVEGWLSV